MKKLYHLFLTFALLSAAGCNDFLDPDDDNSYKGDELLTYIQRAEGVLLNAYASVPNANQISVMTDVATDNAVVEHLVGAMLSAISSAASGAPRTIRSTSGRRPTRPSATATCF